MGNAESREEAIETPSVDAEEDSKYILSMLYPF